MNKIEVKAVCGRLLTLAGDERHGTVHSVFDHAANLLFEAQNGEPALLVGLLPKGKPLVPYGITLAEAEPLLPRWRQGEPAVMGDGGVAVGGAPVLRLSLTEAMAIELSIDAGGPLSWPADVDAKLAALARVIVETPGAQMGLAPVLVPEQSARANTSVEAFANLSPNEYSAFFAPRLAPLAAFLLAVAKGEGPPLENAEALGASLAGCGPGLTPSSDDFLIGVLLALQGAFRCGGIQANDVRALCAALARGAASATGTISAAYLRAAGEGLFSADILALTRCLFSKQPAAEITRTAQAAAAHGATSGVDTLAGLWYALDTLQRGGQGMCLKEKTTS